MAPEEIGSYIPESIGEGGEGVGQAEQDRESMQQAIARIEKGSKKAKQTRGQIQQQKKDNRKIAKFLALLLQILPDDILHTLHLVFFSSDTGGPNKNINHKVIIGLFAPFYTEQIQEHGLTEFYVDLIPKNQPLAVLDYTKYLKELSFKFHDNIALNQQRFLQLIINILTYYQVIKTKELEPQKKNDLIIAIIQELFGVQHHIDIDKVKL